MLVRQRVARVHLQHLILVVLYCIVTQYAESDFIIKFLFNKVRYDTRCYFNVRSKADMSQLNLPQ